MEVKPGFKKTEVGVIPEDWECTTVDQLVREGVLEKPLDGNHGNIHPKSGDFVSFGIPFVMANNIRGGHVDLSNCAFIRKDQADQLQKGFSKPGDVLLTHKATIGNTAVVGEVPFPYIMLTPQVTYYRVADRTRLSNTYLRQFFDSSPFQSVLLPMSGGGTRAYIGITAQLRLPVVLPPTKTEQEAIAEALSDVDALVESLEQLLVKKRQLKQGAMQEFLTGKKCLPGFSHDEQSYRPTKFGMMPGDWVPTSLERIAAFITKGSTPTTYGFSWQNDGVLFLRSECVSERGLDLSQSMFISDRAHQVLRRSKVCAGDILMTITGNVGRVVYLGRDFGEANINQHIARIRIIDEQVADTYVVHFLSQLVVRRYYNLITTGQAYPRISLLQVRETEVPMPSFAEQTAIAAILSDMDAEIAALEAKLTKARQLKQGMMQELLTGRIRLV